MMARAVKRFAPPTAALLVAMGMHGLALAVLVYMPPVEMTSPLAVSGFEVVDLSAFGVAARPEPELASEPLEEETAEDSKSEPEPAPEPEPDPAPLPMPDVVRQAEFTPPPTPKLKPQPIPKPQAKLLPKPVSEPTPAAKPKRKTAPKAMQKAQAKAARNPQPKQRTAAAAGSQSAFVPPQSKAAYLRNPKPIYPAIAQRRGMQGVVLLYVEVSSQGLPFAVKIKKSSGFMLLDKAALKAVRAWRFAPATRGGRPVAAGVEVPIRFTLNDA